MAHGGLERRRDENEKERRENEKCVTNYYTTTKMRRNKSDPQPYPSIEIGAGVGTGWDGTRLEKSRREKRFISVVPLRKRDKMKMRTIYLVPNLGGHDFLQMIPNIPSARKGKREMVVAFECTRKSPRVLLEKKRKHGRNSSA